jgi:hypothetical protein
MAQATLEIHCRLHDARSIAQHEDANTMNRFSKQRCASLLLILSVFSVSAIAAGGSRAASPRPDESELLAAGFKVLVATTTVQQDWVKSLPPGEIRPMQRTGKKYFIYPDASKNQIYVGGPQEYEAYVQLHPERRNEQATQAAQVAADKASYLKQSKNMQTANSRDMSNPFLGASWNDLLGW